MAKAAQITRNIVHGLSPAKLMSHNTTRKAFMQFADTLDFVYFGAVSRDDDHTLVRGVLASVSHSDQHYTVGTYKEYDISAIVRKDRLQYHDKRVKSHAWTILTVDLHAQQLIPDFFICHHSKRDIVLAKHLPTDTVTIGQHNMQPAHPDFDREYSVYTNPSHAHIVDVILSTEITQAISIHLKDMSIEVQDNTIFIYSTTGTPSRRHLEKMLEAGVWLGQVIDAMYVQPQK